MKAYFLLGLFLFISFKLSAQIKEFLPDGFKTAEIPDVWKNYGSKVAYKVSSETNSDSAIPSRNDFLNRSMLIEELIGNTFYDFQTNASSGSRLLANSDGSISAVWNFSPDAIQSSSPPFPNRGVGYNYNNGITWIYPGGPLSRTGPVRAGFPNIVVTPSGKEMIISQAKRFNSSGAATDSNYIVIDWRATKGSTSWDTLIVPWGNNVCHSLPKACGGYTNENVYIIFQGKEGNTLSQRPPSTIEGFYGPIYFSRSFNSGLSWSVPQIISLIDSTNYLGFSGESYSIDASGDTVVISYGNAFTDVGILKSTNAGFTWTKQIIQLHPQPFYNINADSLTDINYDGVIDTISSNSGDSKVLIDRNGMCHVWFSALRYLNDSTGDGVYTVFYATDNLYYWNESMPQNNGYVAIARAQDFSGNGILDIPVDSSPNCIREVPWGQYYGGITQMPSAGVDTAGNIFLAYQTVAEYPEADTAFYHKLRRHIFVMRLAPPYNPADWTYPYNIVPSVVQGGAGFDQEAVFASMAPRLSHDICILYQRDNAPGHSQSFPGTCDRQSNNPFSNDIIINCLNPVTIGISDQDNGSFFVSQNYPNPTDVISYFNIRLIKSTKVDVKIFDLAGRLVHQEMKGEFSAGSHAIAVDISALPPGFYSYLLTAHGNKSGGKMIVH